jgi:polysaccharide pyruvyl transferase WcaK-like protein
MEIAIFGTFDVNNYGDLLFPYIAEFRLSGHDLTFVSPTNSATAFSDSKKVINHQEAQKKGFDLVVIGGGNIIHTHFSGLETYRQIGTYAYPQLWIGAAKMALKQKIPYVFNAPSVSNLNASSVDKVLYRSVLNFCSYISFREEFSKKFAQQFANGEIECVPDTALEIAKVWPYEQPTKKKIVINLNDRYHADTSKTAGFIEQIAEALGLDIEVIVIGDCHGDLEFSRKVFEQVGLKNKKLVERQDLKSLAHSIAGASFFIGSSMHGFITALSYKVPCLLVLNNGPMHKFLGLIREVKLDERVICANWEEALARLSEPAIIDPQEWQNIESRLNKHWAKIEQASVHEVKPCQALPLRFWRQLIGVDRFIQRAIKGVRILIRTD